MRPGRLSSMKQVRSLVENGYRLGVRKLGDRGMHDRHGDYVVVPMHCCLLYPLDLSKGEAVKVRTSTVRRMIDLGLIQQRGETFGGGERVYGPPRVPTLDELLTSQEDQ